MRKSFKMALMLALTILITMVGLMLLPINRKLEPPYITGDIGMEAAEIAKNQLIITRIQYEIAHMGEVEKRDFIDTILACENIRNYDSLTTESSLRPYLVVAQSCQEGITKYDLLYVRSNNNQLRGILSGLILRTTTINLLVGNDRLSATLENAQLQGGNIKEFGETDKQRFMNALEIPKEYRKITAIISILKDAIRINPTLSSSLSDSKE